jgi:hypothetical protein
MSARQVERRSIRADVQRGPGQVLIGAPRGKTRSSVTEILLAAPPPTAGYSVLILDDAGKTVLNASGTIDPGKPAPDRARAVMSAGDFVVFSIPVRPPTPGLSPGHYLVEVTATSPFGSSTARESFEVVSDADRSRFDSALASIALTVPADVAPLIASHFAWRQNFLGDAFHLALDAARLAPDDEVTSETLAGLLQP